MSTATTTAIAEIAARIAVCTRCPLHQTRTKPVPGEGLESSPIMLIGEGPGGVEDQTGRPFVGPAGGLLDTLLEAAALPRGKLFITNSIHCRAQTGGRDRPPSSSELAACRVHLAAELEAVNPRIVVLLGGTAVRATLRLMDFSIAEMRGHVLRRAGRWVLPTYHPSAELHARNGRVRKAIAEDLELLRDVIDIEFGTLKWPWSDEALVALFGEAPARLPSTDAVGPAPTEVTVNSLAELRSAIADPAPPTEVRTPRVTWAVTDLRGAFRSTEVVCELLGRFAHAVVSPDARVGSLPGHDERGLSIAPWHGPYLSAPVVCNDGTERGDGLAVVGADQDENT